MGGGVPSSAEMTAQQALTLFHLTVRLYVQQYVAEGPPA
jgi:hypothetical protein